MLKMLRVRVEGFWRCRVSQAVEKRKENRSTVKDRRLEQLLFKRRTVKICKGLLKHR